MGYCKSFNMFRNRKHTFLMFFLLITNTVWPAKGGMANPGERNMNALPEVATVGSIAVPITPNRFEPYFDALVPQNVTALVGKSAYLTCRVRNLGNKTVSWIRHRDIHILTVGSYTYTSDQRFQANHHAETDEWTLQIKWAQKRDAGIYECQISTQPVRSYFVNLEVVENLVEEEQAYQDEGAEAVIEKPCTCTCRNRNWPPNAVPTAQILGGPDLHVDKGSTINLTCSIRFSPEPPAYIFWYHHDDVISYDSTRGGVSVITEKGDVTTSFLLIQHADISDSGKYSCSPSNADVASVRVHVLNGERPAAMQTGSAGLSNSSLNILIMMVLSYLCSSWYLEISDTTSLSFLSSLSR